jgi:hypothetical protein
MRRALTLVSLLLWAIPAWATISLHKHAGTDNGNVPGTSVGIVMQAGVSLGDFITCEFTLASNSTFTNVTDTLNVQNYVVVMIHTNTTNASIYGIAYFQNSLADSSTFTIKMNYTTSSKNAAMGCQAWSGVSTTGNVIDQSQQQDGTTTNPTSGSNLTPVGANELVIAAVGMNVQTPTAGTNYTLTDVAAVSLLFPEYWIQTTATATNGAFVEATTDTWTDQMVIISPIALTTTRNMPAGIL